MKRFAPLFVALVLSIQVAGCDSGGGGGPAATAPPSATAAPPATVKGGGAKGARPLPNPANPNGPKNDR